MARAKRWQCNFVSRAGVSCHVDIYDDGWSGSVTTVTGADDPFYFEEDDDSDLLNCIRYKTGYISLVEENTYELMELYPDTDFSHYVEVYYGSECVFTGYMQAQSFDNEFAPCPRVIQYPVVSPLGLLGSKEFAKPVAAGMVTLQSLLETALSGLDAGINTIDFPSGLTRTSPTGMSGGLPLSLSDTISSLAVFPWNDNFNIESTADEIFQTCTYEDFVKALCNAFGVIAHDEPGKVTFVPISGSGSGNADIDDSFELADDNGSEGMVRPIHSVEVTSDGSTEMGKMSYDRLTLVRYQQPIINNPMFLRVEDINISFYFFKCLTGEFSPINEDFESVSNPTQGAYLISWNRELKEKEVGDIRLVLLKGGSVNVTLFEHGVSNTQCLLGIKMKDGGFFDLVDTNGGSYFNLTVAISMNGHYCNGTSWQASFCTMTSDIKNGLATFRLPNIPGSHPITVTIYRPNGLAEERILSIEELKLKKLPTTSADAMIEAPWYNIREKTGMTFKSSGHGTGDENVGCKFSYAVRDTNLINVAGIGMDSIIDAGHPTNFGSMFNSQKRLKLKFRIRSGASVNGMYKTLYHYYNSNSWHVLAIELHPWDDEATLTLQTMN